MATIITILIIIGQRGIDRIVTDKVTSIRVSDIR